MDKKQEYIKYAIEECRRRVNDEFEKNVEELILRHEKEYDCIYYEPNIILHISDFCDNKISPEKVKKMADAGFKKAQQLVYLSKTEPRYTEIFETH